jgi:hypothetical protein
MKNTFTSFIIVEESIIYKIKQIINGIIQKCQINTFYTHNIQKYSHLIQRVLTFI